eukprot:scaffold103530_cov55-Phaeocystis_antarctica.AAC.1
MSRCSRMGSNYALAAFADAFLAGELSPHVKPDPRDEMLRAYPLFRVQQPEVPFRSNSMGCGGSKEQSD